jgi:hypothetical protein
MFPRSKKSQGRISRLYQLYSRKLGDQRLPPSYQPLIVASVWIDAPRKTSAAECQHREVEAHLSSGTAAGEQCHDGPRCVAIQMQAEF